MLIGVDLGSTNSKAAIYDNNMNLIDRQSCPLVYDRTGGFVEFDAEQYVLDLMGLIASMVKKHGLCETATIAFTGQAESLVCVGKDGRALMNAISWMDERSQDECRALEGSFPSDLCERITGQQAVLPTWPATKILWLKNHRPEVYEKTATFMLLKDFVVYKLTGRKLADMSIATFTFYFDIYGKCYWKKMLDAIGITEEKLPPLVEPCSDAGCLTEEAAAAMELPAESVVNVGTLDHFAGMIGTGNVTLGGMTLSTGTVMALATMAQEPAPRDSGIAMHYGFLPDTHVMLPVAESGGVSLGWFHDTCMGGLSFDEMNEELGKRETRPATIFLPYLVGTNAPEFDADAAGAFFGLRQENDVYDMAYAVMEGVAFMLRKNCEEISRKGTQVRQIVATGGGSKSPVWCQLQADITGLPVLLPMETEAACLGAAMAAAVSAGRFNSYAAAAKACVGFKKTYEPKKDEVLERKYRQFCALYDACLQIRRMK